MKNPASRSLPLHRLRFEAMRIPDLDDVLAIENASFPTPWSRAAYHRELVNNGYATYLVAKIDGRVVSYGGMWVILDEAHVTNIAVHPDFRNLGVGRLTMTALERKARELGACRMTLEVRVSNAAARHLYESLGFRGTGVRRNYYSDTREDAIVMWKEFLASGEAGPGAHERGPGEGAPGEGGHDQGDPGPGSEH